MTSTLAGRDQIIGELIQNLNEVLVHIGDRDDQLSDLIVQLPEPGQRARQRTVRRSSARSTGSRQLRVETAGLVEGVRPSLVQDIKELRSVAGNLDKNKAEIDRTLQVLPIKLTKVGRTAIYGSWFNFYLCHFKGQVVVGHPVVTTTRSPGRPVTPTYCRVAHFRGARMTRSLDPRGPR